MDANPVACCWPGRVVVGPRSTLFSVCWPDFVTFVCDHVVKRLTSAAVTCQATVTAQRYACSGKVVCGVGSAPNTRHRKSYVHIPNMKEIVSKQSPQPWKRYGEPSSALLSK